MNQNLKTLIKQINDNPELPIIPMVNGEVCCDDEYAYYIGRWGSSEVGEYTEYDEKVYFDRDEFEEDYYSNNDDMLCEEFGYDPRMAYGDKSKFTPKQLRANDVAEKKLNDYLDSLSESRFKKAIIVCIELPD